jgi:hypothetical protein
MKSSRDHAESAPHNYAGALFQAIGADQAIAIQERIRPAIAISSAQEGNIGSAAPRWPW